MCAKIFILSTDRTSFHTGPDVLIHTRPPETRHKNSKVLVALKCAQNRDVLPERTSRLPSGPPPGSDSQWNVSQLACSRSHHSRAIIRGAGIIGWGQVPMPPVSRGVALRVENSTVNNQEGPELSRSKMQTQEWNWTECIQMSEVGVEPGSSDSLS